MDTDQVNIAQLALAVLLISLLLKLLEVALIKLKVFWPPLFAYLPPSSHGPIVHAPAITTPAQMLGCIKLPERQLPSLGRPYRCPIPQPGRRHCRWRSPTSRSRRPS